MFGEYFSRDTKVSEFANVENVPIAALMHVFMHGRSRARLWKMPSIFLRGTRYILLDTRIRIYISPMRDPDFHATLYLSVGGPSRRLKIR